LDAETQSNREECRALYERKGAELILYGRALGLTHGEAEDVLQETFVALLRQPSWPEQPERYCVRAYRNRAFNLRRSLWNRVRHELESHRWFERSPAESPWERAAMRCLARLPVEQREVIVLKIWHQQTFEEIGLLLDLSANTAAGRYRYGMQKLRTCLNSHEHERPESTGIPTAVLDTASPLAGA
jgi:RNA polymerase sigma-70 factor (ECF subfamily)